MVNGYYGVVNGNGNEISTGLQTWTEAESVAKRYLASNPSDTVCEIFVGGGTTREGDNPGDEWEIKA